MHQSILLIHGGPMGPKIRDQLTRFGHTVDFVSSLDDAKTRLRNTYPVCMVSLAIEPRQQIEKFFVAATIRPEHIPMRRIAILDNQKPKYMEEWMNALRIIGFDAGFELAADGKIPDWIIRFMDRGMLDAYELAQREASRPVITQFQANERMSHGGRAERL